MQKNLRDFEAVKKKIQSAWILQVLTKFLLSTNFLNCAKCLLTKLTIF